MRGGNAAITRAISLVSGSMALSGIYMSRCVIVIQCTDEGFGRDGDVTALNKIHTFLNNWVRVFIESLPIGKVEVLLARQRLEV